jgi:hypothetical protein
MPCFPSVSNKLKEEETNVHVTEEEIAAIKPYRSSDIKWGIQRRVEGRH